MNNADILIVDDEADIRGLVQGILDDEGYATRSASNSSEAYREIEKQTPSLIILDIWLQASEHDGMEILESVKEQHPHVPVLMISGHGSIETAVTSIKYGAYDFIEKPFKSDRLLLMIQRALENANLKVENERLRGQSHNSLDLVGQTPIIQNIKQIIKRVAPTNSRVLLTGDPGTGKDIAARLIHSNSNRSTAPYLVLNCATLQPSHLEVELFGTEEGVNARAAQIGILEKAHGGTLLLDEVADMPMETQGKIVRALQNQTFQKLGGNEEIEVDVRIIASTNKNLEDEIKNGNFREDLYYRLNVVPIDLPSLKERTADIPVLIEYFMKLLAEQLGASSLKFSDTAHAVLQSYAWPGNIRQLKNVIEWLFIMHGDKNTIEDIHLPPEISGVCSEPQSQDQEDGMKVQSSFITMPLRDAREAFEKDYLSSQIKRFGGNISKTAEFVGMERSALHRKLKSLNITLGDKVKNASDDDKKQRKRA